MDIKVYLEIQATVNQDISDFDLALSTAVAQFPAVRVETIRSIVGQEYTKFIKANFRNTHSSENRKRVYRLFSARLEEDEYAPGVICHLAIQEKSSPALLAKLILEEYIKEQSSEEESDEAEKKTVDKALRSRVNALFKNHALIQDRDLAHEVLLAKVKDNGYGPIAEAIKQSIGEEHEQKIKDQLTSLNIPFSDEHILRRGGYDKTPDVKLEVPVAVNGKVINWIESKALFGDRESHEGYLKDQFWSYWNRFGPGLVIYWFGYIKELDSNTEAGIVLADSFPTDITFFQPEAITAASTLGDQQRTKLGDRRRRASLKSVGDLASVAAPNPAFAKSFAQLSISDK